MFFRLSSVELGLIIFAVVLGTTLLGALLGHRLRHRAEALRKPFGVLQAALLGLVALILAFGLTMAVAATTLAGRPSWTRRTRSAPRAPAPAVGSRGQDACRVAHRQRSAPLRRNPE